MIYNMRKSDFVNKSERSEPVRSVSFFRMFVPHVIAVLGAFAGAPSYGEEGLAPMAGTGGPMRDAERRVLGDIPRKDVGKQPEIIPEQKAEGQPKPGDEKVLGEVAAIRFFGSTEFAEKHALGDRLLAALGSGEKTVAEVTAAMTKVRLELMKEGYYLLRLSISRKETYDRGTKTLAILVDEGRFGRLTIKFEDEEDGFWFSKDQIRSRFRQIEEGDTFDYNRFRGLLFDANAHPDLTIDTAIDVRKPIEGEGNDRRITRYADLNLDVHESCPFHAVWEVNNYGMEEINEWQTALTLQYLNLTKHDDVLTISPQISFGAEMMSIAGSYMLPHDYWLGGNTTLYGGYSYLDVNDIVPQLDLEGTGYFGGLQHTENIYNSDRHLLAVSVGILWRYLEDQYSALGYSLNQRGASILPLSLALSYTGKKADFLGGRNFATIQGLFNVMNSGDSLDELWTGAEENYWLTRCQLARLQPLFGWFDQKTEQDLHQWMLFLKLEGQYTSDTLIPVEKLSLGGYNCLRGYRTRGYLGDYGLYGTAEIRTPILVDMFSACFGDRTDKTPIDRLQFLAFYDYGLTFYNDLPSGYDDSLFLCSAGVGARLALTKYSQLRCDVAFPFTDGDNDDQDDFEFYLGVQIQY